MKSIYIRKSFYLFLLLVGLGFQSCFDLQEETFNILESKVYYRNKASIEGIIGRLYTSNDGNEDSFTEMQELPSDQVNWRTWNAGAWGWDEGAHYIISIQNWTAQTTRIINAWKGGFNTIGLCNSAIEDFSALDIKKVGVTQAELDSYIAEVRTLRAWMYYRMFELYGGVLPLCTTIDPSKLPSSAGATFDEGCKNIYNFIDKELDESVDKLPKNVSNRMNQATNRILKARLLLNAKLFIKEDHYSDCATICQDLKDGKFGNYTLANNYQDIFASNNDKCTEVIFATSWQQSYYNNINLRVAPYISGTVVRNYFGDPATPPLNFTNNWNCWIISPSKDNSGNILLGQQTKSFLFDYGDKLGAVVDRMNDNDIRKQNYVYDLQTKTFKGILLKGDMKANFGTGVAIKADADRNGQSLTLVDQVGTFQNKGKTLETVMNPRWGETNSGVRLIKYPVYPGITGLYTADADNVYFRFSEVYYMLAECKLRSGDPASAKSLVNEVRKRYFTSADWALAKDYYPGFATIDLDWMLSQWGLEFLAEGQRRRTDLRRFDKFTQGQWWYFGRAVGEDGAVLPAKRDRKFEWYPIPQTALAANPKLSQNPDYK
jgi:hypothetical protein